MNSYGEWTMTPSLTNQNYAFIIHKDGYIYADGYVSFKNHSTRPVFYLSTTSTYSYAGNGSKANPYRYYNLSLISFTIAGTTYYAEEGMTWGEWLSSAYNTIGFKVGVGAPTTVYDSNCKQVTHNTYYGSMVTINEVINNNDVIFIQSSDPSVPACQTSISPGIPTVG
jgi:hypothetical protein